MHASTRGGLEKYAIRIASAFLKRGDEITCLTTGKIEQIPSCVFPVRSWPTFVKLEQFDKCVSRWVKQHSPDIVFGMERNRIQTHLRAGNGVHAAFLKMRRTSEGWMKYGICQINPLHRKILELEKAAFECPKLKKIFVNSRMVQKEVLRHYHVDPAKIEVIYNGVEWQEFEKPFSNWQRERFIFFEKFGLDPHAFHLLFIGNGYQRKGLEPLLTALSLWKFKDFHLSVVGKEKRIDRFRALAARLKIDSRVRFFGAQNGVIPFYQMADVLTIPSFYDPFANVTLEALSFGLFVISSKANGGHEILKEKTGIGFDEISPASILAALERSLYFRKTVTSANEIRSEIASFDFSNQLAKLMDAC